MNTANLLSLAVCLLASVQAEPKIKAIAIISRHSDRTTEYTFPADLHPLNNKEDWPNGEGQLTRRGRYRAGLFAELIKKRYDSLFGIPGAGAIARSSGAQRTRDTAGILSRTITNNAQVPVTVDENLLRDPVPNCDAIKAVKKSIYDSKENEEFSEANDKLFRKLTKGTGKEIGTIEDAYEVHDTIKVEKENNMTIPDFVTDEIMDFLKWTDSIYSCINSASHKTQKLQLGLLLSDLQKNLEDISNGESSVRLLIYTTHDTKISMLQRVLNAYTLGKPAPYLAAIVVELYQDPESGTSFVKAYYTYLDNEYKQFEIPAAPSSCEKGQLCNLNDFFAGLAPFMLDEQVNECANTDVSNDVKDDFAACFQKNGVTCVQTSLIAMLAAVIMAFARW